MSWKFAFSTLGTPGEGLTEVIDLAVRSNCDGVELRVHEDEFLHLGLAPESARAIGDEIHRAGLTISALAGYSQICAPGDDAPVVHELSALVRLAGIVGAQSIRVFPGGEQDIDGRARERILEVLPLARRAGVRILVETHDSHPTGRQALRLVDGLGAPHEVAVLWDGLHPWRSGESVHETIQVLGDRLGYFQIKDAVERDQRWVPEQVGAGAVPVDDQARALQDFSGWVSFEWEKAWHSEIPALSEALPSAQRWLHQWEPLPERHAGGFA